MSQMNALRRLDRLVRTWAQPPALSQLALSLPAVGLAAALIASLRQGSGWAPVVQGAGALAWGLDAVASAVMFWALLAWVLEAARPGERGAGAGLALRLMPLCLIPSLVPASPAFAVAWRLGLALAATLLAGLGLPEGRKRRSMSLGVTFLGALCVPDATELLPTLWQTRVLGFEPHGLLGADPMTALLPAQLLPMLLLAILWVRRLDLPAWAALKDCLRPSRMGVYLLLLNGGFVAAAGGRAFRPDPWDLSLLALLNLALASGFVAQVALNDYFDLDIDRFSNSQRPLVQSDAEGANYAWLAGICTLLAPPLAILARPIALMPLLLVLGLGWVYSAPPFRLRRYMGVAHLNLACIGMGSFLLGATLVHGNLTFARVNLPLLGLIGGLFFVASQFKDFKDMEGDRAQGVSTLATWLGPVPAYWISGALMLSVAGLGIRAGLLPANPWILGALGAFTVAWATLRHGERLMKVMAIMLGVFMVGAVWR